MLKRRPFSPDESCEAKTSTWEQETSPKKVVAMQKALETVHVDPAILSYIIEIVQRTREDHRAINGACLVPAVFRSRPDVQKRPWPVKPRIPDDIKGIAPQIISHRINMKPEARFEDYRHAHRSEDPLRGTRSCDSTGLMRGSLMPALNEVLPAEDAGGCTP